MIQGQFFKQHLTGLNSEFSFSLTSCLTKAEETSLPYYLPIAGGRIIGVIPFPRVLVLCEMPSVSSRIWTRVTVSISYDDYTTGTSKWSFIISGYFRQEFPILESIFIMWYQICLSYFDFNLNWLGIPAWSWKFLWAVDVHLSLLEALPSFQFSAIVRQQFERSFRWG